MKYATQPDMSMQAEFSAKDVTAVIVTAAMIQFINVMDFMMVMPLGPDFSKALSIPFTDIGKVGGAYTLAAAVVGFLAAVFIDRFARKTAILSCMAGLVAATFLGSFAWNESSMIATRLLAGAFGGLITSLGMAFIADVTTPQARGAAMGKMMAGFAGASVFGVPFGLELAERFNWRAPFISTAVIGTVIWLFASVRLPYYAASVAAQSSKQMLASLLSLLRSPIAQMAYVMIGLAMLSGFMIIPNISAHIQINLHYPRSRIGLLYLIGGAVSLCGVILAGKLTDRTSSTFTISLFTALLIAALLAGFVFYSPSIPVIVFFPLFMVAMSGRMVCAQTLSSRIPPAHERGAYMSLQSSLTQLASAFGAYYSSQVLVQGDGQLLHMPIVGLTAIIVSIAVPFICWRVEKHLISQ